MTYIKVKSLMEDNPKITKAEVMKKVDCGELQAAAWMQRYRAEVHFTKHPDDPFDGPYRGSKPVRRTKAREKDLPVQSRVTNKGKRVR